MTDMGVNTSLAPFRPAVSLRAGGPVWIGLCALIVPTLLSLAESLWTLPEQGQGPVLLLVILWLFWSRSKGGLPQSPGTAWGLAALIPGVALYVFGRSQQVWLFEIGAFIPVLSGLLLLAGGRPLCRHFRFALFFIVFLIPQPGFIVDWLTSDLKTLVSAVAETAVFWLGYPVSRNGILLNIGQYQLLVADACSGMNSMFSLGALGVLFLHFRQRKDRISGVLLLCAILPVSVLANVVRVMTLMLVTYYLGDAVGQGFVHQFAGTLLFAVALALLVCLDQLLRRCRPGGRA